VVAQSLPEHLIQDDPVLPQAALAVLRHLEPQPGGDDGTARPAFVGVVVPGPVTAKLRVLATEQQPRFRTFGLPRCGFRRGLNPPLTFRRSVLATGHRGRLAFPEAGAPTLDKSAFCQKADPLPHFPEVEIEVQVPDGQNPQLRGHWASKAELTDRICRYIEMCNAAPVPRAGATASFPSPRHWRHDSSRQFATTVLVDVAPLHCENTIALREHARSTVSAGGMIRS